MEGIFFQTVIPAIKCLVILVLVFTADVLASHDYGDSKTGVHHAKLPYVRTFTKYHHRRTIQWNTLYDKSHSPHNHLKNNNKHVGKRSVNLDDIYGDSDIDIASGRQWRNIIKRSIHPHLEPGFSDPNQLNEGYEEITDKNVDKAVEKSFNKFNVKAGVSVTDAPTTVQPGIKCLYKIHKVALSVTPSYDDDSNGQYFVENDNFDSPGALTTEQGPDGAPVTMERCADPHSACYTLWRRDDGGNVTVLGQGCWRGAASHGQCGRCRRVAAALPGTRFCCCAQHACNARYLSLQEEPLPPLAAPCPARLRDAYLCVAAAAAAALLCAVAWCYRRRRAADVGDHVKQNGVQAESLSSGLCVDNITLIEHIGQGRFGTVWRAVRGASPVAVKLCAAREPWAREVAVYTLPGFSHPNILKYYGSEARPTLTAAGDEHLIVLELCVETLRARLRRAAVRWRDAARWARQLAAAVAYLHSPPAGGASVAHRDISSVNVLLAADGGARLADLGLAAVLHAAPRAALAECGGTARYLAPEVLDGAVDVRGARAALHAVDVFAVALVLWELLHCAAGRDHQLPYEHAGVSHADVHTLQNLVSRQKVRPPLPPGPHSEPHAARVLADTCAECWDHDAEARLTAVCVEERLTELEASLDRAAPPAPPALPTDDAPPLDDSKASNPRPAARVGRNPCLERNTHTHTQPPVTLIHKSLKDIASSTQPPKELRNNPIEVPMGPEVPSYRRPLHYVANDVTVTSDVTSRQRVKDTNVRQERPRWLHRLTAKLRPRHTEVRLLVDRGPYTHAPYEPCLSPPNRTLSPNMVERNADATFDPNVFAVIVPQYRDTTKASASSKCGSEDSTAKPSSATSSRASVLDAYPDVLGAYPDVIGAYPDVLAYTDTSSDDEEVLLLSDESITLRSRPEPHYARSRDDYASLDSDTNKENSRCEVEYVSETARAKPARQRSLEQVDALFGRDARLRRAAGRAGTPGDPPPALRRARAQRHRLSLYDDRVMLGYSL